MNTPAISIFEEHSEVLAEWSRRDLSRSTVVYLDAHLDLQQIAPERMASLFRCSSPEEIDSLKKEHILAAGDNYSYTIEDFLYAASQLDLIGKIVWVCPGFTVEGLASVLKPKLQLLEGVSEADLAGLVDQGSHLEVELFGIPLVVCSFVDLEKLSLPASVLLDIDIDYFISSDGNPWVSVEKVWSRLASISSRFASVTITRSVASGFTPLRYRFIADYLVALVVHEQSFISHYRTLFCLDHLVSRNDMQAGAEGCRAELAATPDCAATHYLLSLCDPDPQTARQAALRASALCAAYAPDLLRRLCEMIQFRDRYGAKALESLTAETGDCETYLGNPLFCAGMAVLSCHLRDLRRARFYYLHFRRSGLFQPNVHYRLGSLYYLLGHDWKARVFFASAGKSPELRALAQLHLGIIHWRRGEVLQAVECLTEAHGARPSLPEPMKLLAHIYQKQGNTSALRGMLKKLRNAMLPGAGMERPQPMAEVADYGRN